MDTNDGIICLCAEGYSGNNCEMDAQNENSIDDEMSSAFGKDGGKYTCRGSDLMIYNVE